MSGRVGQIGWPGRAIPPGAVAAAACWSGLAAAGRGRAVRQVARLARSAADRVAGYRACGGSPGAARVRAPDRLSSVRSGELLREFALRAWSRSCRAGQSPVQAGSWGDSRSRWSPTLLDQSVARGSWTPPGGPAAAFVSPRAGGRVPWTAPAEGRGSGAVTGGRASGLLPACGAVRARAHGLSSPGESL